MRGFPWVKIPPQERELSRHDNLRSTPASECCIQMLSIRPGRDRRRFVSKKLPAFLKTPGARAPGRRVKKKFLGVRTAEGRVLRNEALDAIPIKIAALEGLAIQEKIADPIFQVGPQPGIVRHWKSDLFAIQNFLWNPVVENPLENVFRCESMDFIFFREGSRELKDLVVKKGNSEFERVRHGHLVGF